MATGTLLHSTEATVCTVLPPPPKGGAMTKYPPIEAAASSFSITQQTGQSTTANWTIMTIIIIIYL